MTVQSNISVMNNEFHSYDKCIGIHRNYEKCYDKYPCIYTHAFIVTMKFQTWQIKENLLYNKPFFFVSDLTKSKR